MSEKAVLEESIRKGVAVDAAALKRARKGRKMSSSTPSIGIGFGITNSGMGLA